MTTPRIPRRSSRLTDDHLAVFEPVPGDVHNIVLFKMKMRDMLMPALDSDNDQMEVSAQLGLMCLTVKEICEKKITNVYPLVEPILNVVQSQYGNVDNYIALKARQNVTGVLRFARVAAQVSAGTLLDSNVLDVVEAETSVVNATVKAVTAWAKSHHDEPNQLDEVERAINQRLGEINFEKDHRAQDIAALYEDLKKPLHMKAPT